MSEANWSIVDVRTGKVVEKDLFLSEAKRNSSKNFKIRGQAPKPYVLKLNPVSVFTKKEK